VYADYLSDIGGTCPKPNVYVADKRSFYKCECTSYVAYRVSNALGVNFTNWYRNAHWSDGKTWDEAAKAANFLVTNTPQAGDIAQWNSGTYGHVAYVESINKNGSANIAEYNWTYPHGFSNRTVFADNYIRLTPSTQSSTLSSVGVACTPITLNSGNLSGSCASSAYYSNNTNKSITGSSSWSSSNTAALSISGGKLTAKNVESNTSVTIKATYAEGSVTKTSSPVTITVKPVDKTDPITMGCDQDAKTVGNPKIITGGKVELRWSAKCGTNWAKVTATNATATVSAEVKRSTISSGIKSSQGNVYSNMLYGRDVQICATGTIGTATGTVCY
jgi:surface antigen